MNGSASSDGWMDEWTDYGWTDETRQGNVAERTIGVTDKFIIFGTWQTDINGSDTQCMVADREK